jgi:hypothetical protein
MADGRPRRRLVVVLLLMLFALVGASPTAHAAGLLSDPAPQNPFSPSSVWNARIPASAPLAPNSAALIATLQREVLTYGPWINSYAWSTPVYQVPANQPTVAVTVDWAPAMWTNPADAAVLASQLSAVPIPAYAQPAAGTDRHLVIWQPSTDTEWEMWLTKHEIGANGPEWHVGWGARIEHVSQSSGIVPYPFGATASGVSELGGLITADEIAHTQIDHALAMALPETEGWGQFVWPANRTDGRSPLPDAIPQGTRLRLDPTVNVDSLPLTPVVRAIALAAQRYGIVVRDTAGAVVFYAEDPKDVGSLGYDWGYGLNPAQALANFPWGRLQVVAVPNAGAAPAAAAPDLRIGVHVGPVTVRHRLACRSRAIRAHRHALVRLARCRKSHR